MRWTMNGGTVCEPPAEPPRWCACSARAGEVGLAGRPGRGGCGMRCEPLRRCADARRDSGPPASEDCVECRKWMSETVKGMESVGEGSCPPAAS